MRSSAVAIGLPSCLTGFTAIGIDKASIVRFCGGVVTQRREFVSGRRISVTLVDSQAVAIVGVRVAFTDLLGCVALDAQSNYTCGRIRKMRTFKLVNRMRMQAVLYSLNSYYVMAFAVHAH
ncbi:hypothetical protein BC835DRAFT_444074 [Cytidiella melzeri]|nr:hypothetical protein BC835DRAFT_444074 [Cytidiella melzeri]